VLLLIDLDNTLVDRLELDPEVGMLLKLAAALVREPLTGWMIGDNAEYDVGGGAAVGLDTVWLPRGKAWPEALPYRPTRVADDCAAAIVRA
jgi:putative hydrolase of the HAD superfamily